MTKQMDAILETIQSDDEVKRAATLKVHRAVEAIFADLDFVNVVAVHGYTPWFMDGDVCVWGIESQVDWMGEAYYSPIEKEEYAKLINEEVPYDKQKSHPNHDNLAKACRVLSTCESDFEIMDENNGTWWMFIRDDNYTRGFRVEKGVFEHD